MFGVAKGILTAATSDNVQPLALLTAEAFGGTLAICQQTLLKVEKHARKNQHSVIKYLQAQVGYFPNDSASHLSSSAHGVRFLSLVAMLLCSSSHFEAAEALDLMIRSSSSQGQMMPTLTQLQDLVEALEPKLVPAGFADEILGWKTLLLKHSRLGRIYKRETCPRPKKLQALVDAFRTCMRLGETTGDGYENEHSSLVLKTGENIPWIISFVKWCSGLPPNILLEDGTPLLRQPGSRVTLCVTETAETDSPYQQPTILTIELFEAIGTPSRLWEAKDHNGYPWNGMISVSSFGMHRVSQLNMDAKNDTEILALAVSYALPLVVEHLRPSIPNKEFMQLTFPIFPPTIEITRSFKEYFRVLLGSSADDLILKEHPGGLDFMELPEIVSSTKHIRDHCSCINCGGLSKNPRPSCGIIQFQSHVSEITADILALSLFDSAELIKVYSGAPTTYVIGFSAAVLEILSKLDNGEGKQSEKFTIADVIERAMSLTANLNVPLVTNQVIASSHKGQVVFVNFFENPMLDGCAINRLGIVPGTLRYKQCSTTW
ncbi:hypothetical protein MMC30_003917 [Trapelia coarctata]|nr:hypothetical protein [Trapelia coarctata]